MHTDGGIDGLTEAVIGRAFAVQNTLGSGFLEKVYENALAHELRKAGIAVAQQRDIAVHYDVVVVGRCTVDLLVEDRLLVELKAVRTIDAVHAAQCLNYLKATGLWPCLLLNFGTPRLQIKRMVNGRRPGAHG
jgi:GxxExxY protein